MPTTLAEQTQAGAEAFIIGLSETDCRWHFPKVARLKW